MTFEIQAEIYLSQDVKLPNFNQYYNWSKKFSETRQYQTVEIL
jgi:hypothetical protein